MVALAAAVRALAALALLRALAAAVVLPGHVALVLLTLAAAFLPGIAAGMSADVVALAAALTADIAFRLGLIACHLKFP
ncbi:MAG: hypothetical protein ACXWJA_09515 [Caldimonas sp.]